MDRAEALMTTTLTGDPVEMLYRATATPRLVEAPALTFLCVDGHGVPKTSPAYAEAIQALYAVSYAAKVSALEGLWWADDMSTFLAGDKSAWDWTMMIRQPAPVTADPSNDSPVEEFVAEAALHPVFELTAAERR
jgi:hypothetical protein